MKHSTIFLIILIVTLQIISGLSLSRIPKGAYDEKVRSFLETFKAVMKTGDINSEIPILDPYEPMYTEIYIPDDPLWLRARAFDVKIDGLSEFTINSAKFKFTGPTISLNLTWPKIKTKCSYTIYATLPPGGPPGPPLYGNGDLEFEAIDSTATVTAKFSLLWNKVYLKKLTTGISLKKTNLTATGLYFNEEASKLVSEMVSSSLPQLIEDFQQSITEPLENRLRELINTELHELKLKNILEWLGNFNQ